MYLKFKNVMRRLRRMRRPVWMDVCGYSVLVRPSTPDIEVAQSCLSGEFNVAIAAANPLVHDLIIDAGGYIGTAAIAFSKAFPQATVITLEPSTSNFVILAENVRPYRNIVAINKALGAAQGRSSLRNRNTGEWGFSIISKPADCPSATTLHDVDVITVPMLLRQFNKTGIDILKLDIEGSEYELLKERPEWLDKTRVLFAELHDRIVPGTTAVFQRATAGRKNSVSGEKCLSAQC